MTKLLYMDDCYLRECDAKVENVLDDNKIILDKTVFYPQGGGVPCDTGKIIKENEEFNVIQVKKETGKVVHYIDKDGIQKGDIVHCVIDWNRRYAMMRHHTATHIINYSARKVLGSHIWQAGSYLDENEARLDVTHYKRISEEEAMEIEKIANEMVRKALPVEKKFMERNEAEKKYGFRLYQGGAPKGGVIRVVNIADLEAEACGGTHVNNTAEIGFIKIIGVERVQDGVERIRFCAGEKALEYIQKQEKLLKEASSLLATEPSRIAEAIKKLIEERKRLKKEIERLQERLGKEKAEEYKGVKIIVEDELTTQAIRELTKEKTVVISASKKGKNALLTIACSADLPIDCAKIAKEIGNKFGRGGGGRKTIGQAGIEINKIDEAKKEAKEMVKKGLES